jgi:hypothetical protein
MITTVDALQSLKPNARWLLRNDTLVWNDSIQTEPTTSELATEVTRLQTEYDALQYQRDRQYPSIGDQLDMQYHDELNGTTTWKDAVAKVKADHPKG